MFRVFAAAVLLIPGSLFAGEPLPIGVGDAHQPRLTVGPGGEVFCAFGAGDDIYCAASRDGAAFGKPAKVASLPGLMLGKRRGPRAAVSGDAVVVSAISRFEGNLLSWRSTDGGKTWSGPVRVNGVEKSCREGLFDMAAGPNGEVGALWLDLRNSKSELWMSVSRDGGASWGEDRLVYRSPDESVCPCCHPTLAAKGGEWLFLWRNSLGGNRDIYVATTADAAGPVRDAAMLGKTNWNLETCPMDGGDLAVGKAGGWAVWRREWNLFAAPLGRPAEERPLGPGEQPVVAVTPAGPVFAWLAKRPGDLLVQSPADKKPVRVASNASDPDLATLPDGSVLLAWEQTTDGKSGVFVTKLTPGRAGTATTSNR
jgi:hypothetical protein